jgi:rubrerythrin
MINDRVETYRRDGDLIAVWACRNCNAEQEVGVDRARSPWFCGSCGQIDRGVESWFDRLEAAGGVGR